MGYGTMGRNVVKLIIPILEGAEVKFVHEHFSNHNEKGTQQAHFSQPGPRGVWQNFANPGEGGGVQNPVLW